MIDELDCLWTIYSGGKKAVRRKKYKKRDLAPWSDVSLRFMCHFWSDANGPIWGRYERWWMSLCNTTELWRSTVHNPPYVRYWQRYGSHLQRGRQLSTWPLDLEWWASSNITLRWEPAAVTWLVLHTDETITNYYHPFFWLPAFWLGLLADRVAVRLASA